MSRYYTILNEVLEHPQTLISMCKGWDPETNLPRLLEESGNCTVLIMCSHMHTSYLGNARCLKYLFSAFSTQQRMQQASHISVPTSGSISASRWIIFFQTRDLPSVLLFAAACASRKSKVDVVSPRGICQLCHPLHWNILLVELCESELWMSRKMQWHKLIFNSGMHTPFPLGGLSWQASGPLFMWPSSV